MARIGVHRTGPLPTQGLEVFDGLLSADPEAPRPWVGLPAAELVDAIDTLVRAGEASPIAAGVLAQVLRMGARLEFADALAVESLAYSALLGGSEFARWRAARGAAPRVPDAGDRVALDFGDGRLDIRLCRLGRRNAFDAAMRDALCDALEIGLDLGPTHKVLLTGEGPAFSAGGDLDEFGSARDLAAAHAIRVIRSPAALAHRLGSRLTVEVHGACIGAGIEVPAAAGKVRARADAFFRLPEVGMGLIPGAGGTASLPRRIGRHRTYVMALGGRGIDARTALAWGLVDELV